MRNYFLLPSKISGSGKVDQLYAVQNDGLDGVNGVVDLRRKGPKSVRPTN
jgi:hypothetical protein